MEPNEKENTDQNMYEPLQKDPKLENFDLIIKDEEEKIDEVNEIDDIVVEKPPQKKRKCCNKFPSAYVILLGFELFSYILTFIIQKGKYQTIEYSKQNFTIKYQNETSMVIPGTQDELDKLGIKIPLKNFQDGLITKPVPIPNTYEKIEGENISFFSLFINPIKGVINSMNISLFIMIISGDINILVETKAMECGIRALIKCTKGKEFLLFTLTFIYFILTSCTIGMIEQSFCFYQIMMPVFLESGIDGMLAAFSIYPATMIGTMFSICMPASVVLASYLTGIHFTDGLVFRLIGLIFANVIVIGYFYFYHRRVRANPTKSFVYDIKSKLESKFLKKKHEEINSDDNEENQTLKENQEPKKEEEVKFNWTRLTSLILFFLGFIVLIVGVAVFGWYFEEMGALFFGISIVLMILSRESQDKAISLFTKGAGNIVGVCLIIGICRGIYFTLDDGKINDSILYGLSKLFEGVPKEVFAIAMIFVFLILGFFIPSSSGLATLSMPIFTPLADVVNVPRYLVINAFMFSQRLMGLISPTSLVLIACQLSGVPFSRWVKFVWPLCLILLVYLLVLILINSAL